MTPAPAARSRSSVIPIARWLAAQAQHWAASDGERWLFVAKTLLAAYGALWIAFRLGLDSPTTAMTTTFILALPSSGMVLEKSFYRLLGTVVGCASALLLTAAFPQQPPLLFAGLAVWLALCTGGAAMHRNQQSYSFVLAGYTAVMIAIPAIDHPHTVLTAAVTRLAEVGLGIICAAVVHDVLLPRHQGAHVLRTVQARYARFLGFCRQVLEHRLAPADAELAHLRFAADIAALESGRAAAFFEASHARAHTRALHAFNGAFMAALTTFYTLHRLIHRLRQGPPSPVPALIETLHGQLAAALAAELAIVENGDAHASGHAPLAGVADALADGIVQARRAFAAGEGAGTEDNVDKLVQPSAARIDFDTALELLQRFAADIAAFGALYHGLARRKRMQVSEPLAYAPKTPPAIVVASGVRAAVALLAGAAGWYWLAWPYAASAVLMTAIFCALASSSPRPLLMVGQVFTGFLLAWPLSFATEFLLVARADGFAMLVLASAPLFALGTWLMTDPKRVGIGIGITLFSAQVVAPSNLMHYDVPAFLGTTLAQVGGVALAYVVFAVVLPGHTMGQRAHVAAALWREALAACARIGPWPARLGVRYGAAARRHRFDNRVRDLLSQLNAGAGPAPDAAVRAVVRQGLTLLELGHAVIALNALIAGASAPHAPHVRALQAGVAALAAYCRAPTPAHGRAAAGAMLDAGGAVRAALGADAVPPLQQARLRSALTELHSIYTSLLDQLPATEGEPIDAP